jgi:phospholipase C
MHRGNVSIKIRWGFCKRSEGSGGVMADTRGAEHRFDHVVVVMFENRSFDNLLGYLYEPGEVASFEGVAGRDLVNPIPEDAPGAERRVVPVHPAENMNTPDPDPGEEYQHVNTQLFGTVAPKENRFKLAEAMQAPFNAPDDPGQKPTMDGFVTDYVNAFHAEMGRMPQYEEYAQIMACYTPELMPVMSTLAKGFACFDHWFCDVPSQTFTNRSFFHAASASGFLVNVPFDAFPLHNDAETIFERLQAAGVPWRVYVDADMLISFTGLIHDRRLYPFFKTHFFSLSDFYEDAANGTLPAYSFIEPNMMHGHNDMHPPVNALLKGFSSDPPSSLLGGEALLATIYDAVRTSSTPDGSNFANTLLLVAFDEHGGTYDHIPPPPAPPPDPASPAGQMGFRFDRSGIRIPTLAISAYIDPRTVINAEYGNTSLIRTLRERWPLGAPLTARDATARDIGPILTRETPRAQEDWPQVVARPSQPLTDPVVRLDRPLPPLGVYLLGTALEVEKSRTGKAPAINPSEATGREAIECLIELEGANFPHIAPGRTI